MFNPNMTCRHFSLVALAACLLMAGSALAAPVLSFDTARVYPTTTGGGGPVAIAVGDLNGDGQPDLAAINYEDTDIISTLTILLGSGRGGFHQVASYRLGVGKRLTGIVIADFNGDRKADLAVGDTSAVAIFLGNGDGTFQRPVEYPALPAVSIVAGDFNGDGKIDLALANIDTSTVGVMLGNGDGRFQSEVNFSLPDIADFVTTGDFNADGKIDLAIGCSSGIAILLGNGNGTFRPAPYLPIGNVRKSVAVGDFNGDGKQDLATVDDQREGTVSILLGNGDGTFQAQIVVSEVGIYPLSVAVADFNRDGKQDLVVANGGSNGVAILLGNGDGTFLLQASYPAGGGPSSVVVGDLNGDGVVDLSICSGRGATILMGRQNGTFPLPRLYPVVGTPIAMAAADFNGDGHLDLALLGEDASQVEILWGETGQASHAPFLNPSSPLAVGDFNGDGKPDLVFTNNVRTAGTVSIQLNNGDSFGPPTSYGVGLSPNSVAVGDLNGDGRLDLAVSNVLSSNISVLLGNGDGTFQPQVTFPLQSQPSGVAIGDFNRDGKLDLAVAEGAIAILLGNGDGTFQPAVAYGSDAENLVVADINGDGIPDLVVGVSDTVSTGIMLGNGDGTFRDQKSVSIGGAGSVAVADFNGDGKLDLAVTDNSELMIALGNGDGTFHIAPTYFVAGEGILFYTTPVAADFDGDGKPDVVVANMGPKKKVSVIRLDNTSR
jgi:hypothetical protein